MVLKTTRWSPDTCDCIIEYQWDDATPPATRTHTLSNYVLQCAAHASLPSDADRYNAVLEENPRKNIAHQGILDNGPSSIFDVQADGTRTLKGNIGVSWIWTGTVPNRVLTITYTGITLTTQQRTNIQNWLNTRFGTGKVLVQAQL